MYKAQPKDPLREKFLHSLSIIFGLFGVVLSGIYGVLLSQASRQGCNVHGIPASCYNLEKTFYSVTFAKLLVNLLHVAFVCAFLLSLYHLYLSFSDMFKVIVAGPKTDKFFEMFFVQIRSVVLKGAISAILGAWLPFILNNWLLMYYIPCIVAGLLVGSGLAIQVVLKGKWDTVTKENGR